jgi:hypothetical protein
VTAPDDPWSADRTRGRRALVATGIVAIVAVVAVLVVLRPWSDHETAGSGGFELRSQTRFSDLPAYRGVADADAIQQEQQRFSEHLRADPVTGIASGTFHGRFTNVDHGVRATTRSTCGGCPKVTVWLVGGSVAFGLGQRDRDSLGSQLVAAGARDHLDLQVTDIAVPGWTIWSDARAVADRLETGRPPDLVIDVGGFNDAIAAMVEASLGVDRRRPQRLVASEVQRFESEQVPISAGGGASAIARRAARAYVAGRTAIQGRCARAGCATAFFFHPDALASATQLGPVRNVTRGLRASRATDAATVLSATARLLAPGTTDLRHLYDHERSSVFVDWAHTGPRGARLLADAIYADVAPLARQAAHAS